MNKTTSLLWRIRRLQYILPPILVLVVIAYQLGVAETVEKLHGLHAHYWAEIAFYSLTGPLVTGLTLVWIEAELRTKERLENALQSIREEERDRIGRDLHDSVAQTLYLQALKTDILQTEADVPPALRDELQHMGKALRASIREIRRTIFSLRQLAWPEGEFLPALEAFVQGYAEEMGWEIIFEQNLNRDIPTVIQTVIFRLVQEALNNTAKHADARRVQVKLSHTRENRSIHIDLKDEGRGFEIDNLPRRGLGLSQMQQRVVEAGGTFELHTQPGEGTLIQVEIPIQ